MARANSVTSLFKVGAHGGAALVVLRRIARALPRLAPMVEAVGRAAARYTDGCSERFDTLHGLDTHSRVLLSSLAFERPLELTTWTDFLSGPICPDFFREIMRYVEVDRGEWTFIDVGAGKGRAVILAHEAGFRRILGLDFSSELIEIAKRNVERYASHVRAKVAVEWIHADATTFDYPPVPSLLFLNNPFPTKIALGVADCIESSLRKHPRPLKIAYRRAPPGATVRFDSSPLLTIATSTPYWRIYEATAEARATA